MQAITAKVIGEEEGSPVVATVAEWLPHARLWCLTFDCPWCGHEHRHGGGSGETPAGGNRQSHCQVFRGGYALRIVDTRGRRTTRARADGQNSITVQGEAAAIRFDTDTGTMAIRGAACVNVDFRLREVCKGMDRGRLQELFETIVFSLTNG